MLLVILLSSYNNKPRYNDIWFEQNKPKLIFVLYKLLVGVLINVCPFVCLSVTGVAKKLLFSSHNNKHCHSET